jgi:hypothetical protein
MKPIYRWLVWFAAAALTVLFGFERGWDTFHKICLVIIIVLGIFNLITPIMQKRMLHKIKNMPPEEREKFLARFDERTQAKLRKQLETTDG